MRWHALGETWPPRGSGVTFSDTRAIHDARVDYYILLHLDRFDTRKETSDRSTRNAPQKVKESTRTLTENFTHKQKKKSQKYCTFTQHFNQTTDSRGQLCLWLDLFIPIAETIE